MVVLRNVRNFALKFSMSRGRRALLLIVVLFVLLNVYLLGHVGSLSESWPSVYKNRLNIPLKPQSNRSSADVSKFLRNWMPTLLKYAPKTEQLNSYSVDFSQHEIIYAVKHGGSIPGTAEFLGQVLKIDREQVQLLKLDHERYVASIPKEMPKGLYNGRGIIISAGGKYFPLALTAIKWIRRRNQIIPIELAFANQDEYEKEFCEGPLLDYGVKCLNLEDIYGKEAFSLIDHKGFPLKVMALLASSFEDVYMMDADSFPLFDVAPLFEVEPYSSHGLVMHSDYWPRTVAPQFYEIANVTLEMPDHADESEVLECEMKNALNCLSSESGQLFVSKKRHFRSLLLALYYNIYGTKHYYPLIMLGGPGMGDKDTFIAAAHVLSQPYYQVMKQPGTLGFVRDGSYKGYAMLQFDPWSDLLKGARDEMRTFIALHANTLKLNPKYLLEPPLGSEGNWEHLERVRYFGNLKEQQKMTKIPGDLELELFETVTQVACDLVYKNNLVPLDWRDQNIKEFCEKMRDHVDWLRESPEPN